MNLPFYAGIKYYFSSKSGTMLRRGMFLQTSWRDAQSPNFNKLKRFFLWDYRLTEKISHGISHVHCPCTCSLTLTQEVYADAHRYCSYIWNAKSDKNSVNNDSGSHNFLPNFFVAFGVPQLYSYLFLPHLQYVRGGSFYGPSNLSSKQQFFFIYVSLLYGGDTLDEQLSGKYRKILQSLLLCKSLSGSY